MIQNAFIQELGNGALRQEERLVAEALGKKGISYQFYTEKRIHRRQLPLTGNSLVVGDMPCMYGAMKQLGIPIPAANTYPKSLSSFMHRSVWQSTVGQLTRDVWEETGNSVFAKPADRQKVFTGQVFAWPSDLYCLHGISQRQPIICSDPVRWLSEYRIYVCNNRVLSVDHYAGDMDIKPSMQTIDAAIECLASSDESYSGYAIDFGVLASGETALVEMNDGFAVGAYAIGAEDYTAMILARWEELLRTIEDK
jgi:hypothetical protein